MAPVIVREGFEHEHPQTSGEGGMASRRRLLLLLNRWIASVALAVVALGAQAQTYYNGNPNIIVPKSSIPHRGKPCTHYLIYIGPSASLPNGAVVHGPGLAASGPAGYHPADIQAAYGMPSDGGTGAIAVVDYGDEGTPLSDFNTFSAQFGLPQETSSDPTASTNKVFQVVYAEGTKPPFDPSNGWYVEEALDMEWAHAMAPKAKIYLVESGGDLVAANQVAAKLTGVKEVSNSWGYPGEYGPGELQLDSNFVYPGVVFFASAGDIGGLQQYPAESPNVVGVGGTSLYMSGNTVTSETVWDGTGGGPSNYEPRPSYQSIIQSIVHSARGCPDIAAVADPYTGVAIYAGGSWTTVGGTSVACPVCAGITNTRGQYKTSTVAELTRVYQNYGSRLYRDITTGSAGSFNGAVGWDFCTGVGCPVGLYKAQITNPIRPTNVVTLTGTLLGGNVTSLYTAGDSNTYNISSTSVVNVGQTTTSVVTFNLGAPSGNLTNTLIGFVESAPATATIQVFAYNWNSKSYDVIQAFPGGNSGVTNTLTLGNLGLYENGSNNIQLAIRTFIPTRLGATKFTSMLDMIQAQPASNVNN